MSHDLVIRGARLVPVHAGDQAPDHPVDVAVDAGVVTAVGVGLDRGRVEHDAAGRHLVPGLWDQHVHLAQWTVGSARLDLSGARSPEQAVAQVAERVAELPDVPVIGWGHRSAGWHREPTVTELDAVSGATPVVLISGDGHHAWLNTTALVHLAMPVRDTVVRETEWFRAYGRLATLVGEEATSPEAYRRAMLEAAARGVVGVVDFEFSGGAADWAARWTGGADVLRVRMATYAEGLDEVVGLGLRTGDPLPLHGWTTDERLTMGSLKIISDGSLNTRTAWCCEPYGDLLGAPVDVGQASGAPNLDADELRDLLSRARAHGLTVATHAIGDAAVAAALDAYEATGATGSVEHAQLVREGDVPRLAALGLRASVQPAHLLDDRDLTERVWGPARAARSFPLRSMLDAGVDVRLGSDAPVSPLDPWLAMAAAVHRSADEREPWHAEQAITVREALAASTDGRGMVAEGSPADLVLLDRDPTTLDGDTAEQGRVLRGLTSAFTVVAGHVVHDQLS